MDENIILLYCLKIATCFKSYFTLTNIFLENRSEIDVYDNKKFHGILFVFNVSLRESNDSRSERMVPISITTFKAEEIYSASLGQLYFKNVFTINIYIQF